MGRGRPRLSACAVRLADMRDVLYINVLPLRLVYIHFILEHGDIMGCSTASAHETATKRSLFDNTRTRRSVRAAAVRLVLLE